MILFYIQISLFLVTFHYFDILFKFYRLAPLALKAVYCESEVECQRMGLLQGFDLLCCELTSAPEQPAYALLGTSPDLEVGVSRVQQLRGNGSAKDAKLRKEVILAIRGTNSVQDVVTDIRANPIHFPPPLSCCSEGLSPALNEPASSTRVRFSHTKSAC